MNYGMKCRSAAAIAALVVLLGAQAPAADLSTELSGLVIKGGQQLPKQSSPSAVGVLSTGDFDCDGVIDLAAGDASSDVIDNVGGDNDGSLSIGFGDPLIGLRLGGGQLISQNTDGISDVAEANDRFGDALAAADFNGDNCSDLAIGVSGEDDASAGTTDSGGVHLLFGAAGGLSTSNDLFLPGTEAAPHGTTGGHRKGDALAALHWTAASALPYLAINAIGHAPNLLVFAGGVSVRRTGSAVLNTPVDFASRSDFPFEADRQSGQFGETLAAGDFNNDGFDDLVAFGVSDGCIIPTPAFSLCPDGKGFLWIVYGAASTGGFRYEKITQDSPGVPGVVEDDDFFGEALAVGDFNSDGIDDLAVGAPDSGSVTILYGAASGLLANAGSSIAFGQSEISGLAVEADDEFGASLSAGDFNRDGFDDLAIGVPLEDVSNVVDAGSVAVVYGSASGIDTRVAKIFDLSSAGISGDVATNDQFGIALSAADFNDDQVDDLAIGIANRADNTGASAGAVLMLFSTGDTATSIVAVTPNPVFVGQPYTVTVRSLRLNTGGTALGRGTVNVSVSGGGGSCTVTLNNTGNGSCQITTASAGLRTISAIHPAILGYRASSALPASINVVNEVIFRNGFE
jgi:hypothetical protein